MNMTIIAGVSEEQTTTTTYCGSYLVTQVVPCLLACPVIRLAQLIIHLAGMSPILTDPRFEGWKLDMALIGLFEDTAGEVLTPLAHKRRSRKRNEALTP